jgi:hypothetical protein
LYVHMNNKTIKINSLLSKRVNSLPVEGSEHYSVTINTGCHLGVYNFLAVN